MQRPDVGTIIGSEKNGIYVYDPFPEEAKPVLFLHGLGASGISWQFQFESLREAGYRPIAPDIPGFGNSGWGHGCWTFNKAVAEILAWLDTLNLSTFSIVGLSMGGVFAQRLAAVLSGKVSAVVLVNTFSSLRPKNLSQITYFAQRFITARLVGVEKQAGLVAQRVFPHPEQAWLREEVIREICIVEPGIYRAAMMELARVDLRKEIASITAPVMIISGANDTTIPLSAQQELAVMIRAKEQFILPGAGHAAPVELPELFNAHLIRFLNQHS